MAKKHVFGVSQTLAFARWISRFVVLSLKPNIRVIVRFLIPDQADELTIKSKSCF
jgi:hypothetical protein